MELLARISDTFTDDRLLANLVGLHTILGLLLLTSFVLRKLLLRGGDQLGRLTGLGWMERVGKEANRRVRSLLFWTTLVSLLAMVLAGITYHVAGRDIRADILAWYQNLTGPQLLELGITVAKLALLAIGVSIVFGVVRRVKTWLETVTLHLLRSTAATAASESSASDILPLTSADAPAEHEPRYQEQTVRHWFFLLERFALATIFLGAVAFAGAILEWHALNGFVARGMHLLAIIMVARLATLACKTLLYAVKKMGDRHLESTHVLLYWERMTRLFPFGQKCFEAAVYVYAASLCVDVFKFVDAIELLGQRIVSCIAIFFVTRMMIELLQVLINEAFGMHEGEQLVVDQKKQTLVPLLQSVSQYVIYFGSVVTMLSVLGVETGPILAGAGILGLAGGLGAQSLVTDLVSGFFILFENQYLVGDVVQIGDAHGRVEAVSIRTTHIRDDSGKLHILPNGQIKNVVNFSKGYVNAVIDLKVPTSSNLELVMRDLAEAGRRLRQQRREVLSETVVRGLVDLNPNDMVVRAVTKVQPGTHLAMQSEFRRHLKHIFDERQVKAA